MRKLSLNIEQLRKSKFLKNVATLASGTAIAQILGFAFIPILARLYPQEAFGLLASYTALVSLISSFATLKYDTALVLPQDDNAAYALLKLSNLITFAIVLICCAILFLPIPYFQEYSGLQIFIAVGAILSINYNNSALWNIRFKEFKSTTIAKIVQVIAVFFFQYVLFESLGLKGLIVGNILGILVSGLYLIYTRKFDWTIYRGITKVEMLIQAKRYIDFPKYFTISNVILSLSSNLPVLVFVKFISISQLGIYGMALKIIAQPVSLISSSFQSVILADMNERKNNSKKIAKWFLKILGSLFFLSIVASGIVILIGQDIVEFFLGSNWSQTGIYIKMLTPLLIGMMIATPGIAAVRVFEMQKYTLHYSIISLVIKGLTLIILFTLEINFAAIILIYSIMNLFLIIGNNTYIFRKIINYDNAITSR